MDLQISSNNAAGNPLTLDLTNYLMVSDKSMDPASPSFTDKVITHSLLKVGGVLSLTDLKNKELVFPMLLNAPTQPALQQLLIEINQVLESSGATAAWQDDGTSQATTFDLIGGQFDIEYDYRKAQKFYIEGKLRLFAQPFGRTAGPRFYAAASGIGPLLMISPYTSAGATGVGATTVRGVRGVGGQPAGPSTGVFYASPGLQGDAPALLQIAYAGPQPVGATSAGVIPTVAVSVLPDPTYQPLVPVTSVNRTTSSLIAQSTAVASQYLSVSGASDTLSFQWPGLIPPLSWAGNHRLFAIARASQVNGILAVAQSSLLPLSASASIEIGDWGVYDLGVLSIAASQQPQQAVNVIALAGASSNAALDVGGFVVIPDYATWFENPSALTPSQYGAPLSQSSLISGLPNPIGLAVDSNYIYWSEANSYAIGRANLNGTSASATWITGVSNPLGVTVDGAHVYWTCAFGASGTIGRANLNGSGASNSWITGAAVGAPFGNPAVDSNYVYWANDAYNSGYNSIGRATIAGANASATWITGASGPEGVAVDSNYVYWTNAYSETIGRANLNGTSPSSAWIANGGGGGITVDPAAVYWSTNAPNTGAIGHANLNGTNASQAWITSGVANPEQVANDSTFIYWVDYGVGGSSNGTINRALKTFPAAPNVAFSNTILLDDFVGQQYLYALSSTAGAPSPVGLQAQATPISAFTRGVVPQPDPKLGLPIIAILGIGQNSVPSQAAPYAQAGASWANPQNLATYAQVNIIERTRYILP